MELVGDVVTTLFINYEWRKLLSDVFQHYADTVIRHLPDAALDDFRNRVQGLLNDLYTPDDMIPVGTIAAFVAENPPSKWLPLKGESFERDTYPDLWNVVPAAWHLIGVGENPDLILLPDMTERFVYGTNTQAEIGELDGEATHTLTIAEMPAHVHDVSKANVTGTAVQRAMTGNNTQIGLQQTSSVGGDGAHNNLPPFIRLVWMIKALP